MRFVRHKTYVDWGLGVIAAEERSTFHILFEGVGYRKIRATPALEDVADADVPYDHRLRRREDWPKVERDGLRAHAKRELPKRFDGFMKEFLSLYPKGLASPDCDAVERNYKWEGVEYARELLDARELEGLLKGGGHEEIFRRAARVIGKLNLVDSHELMKLGGVPPEAYPVVAERIFELVVAGEKTPDAVEAFALALAPHSAAKWTVCSLIPFLLNPDRWPFVKPTFIRRAEKATGIDVEYDPKPNARTYSLVRELYEHVAILLGDRAFAPRDFIDVQTFLWVASGMAREAIDARAEESLDD